MSYLLKSSREKKQRSFPFYVVLIFFCVVVLITFFFPGFFPAVMTRIALPFWKSEHAITGSVSTAFLTKDALVKENTELKMKLEALKDAQVTIGSLQIENEELKSILHRADSKNLVLAAILRKPPLTPYDTLIIDSGVKENIKVGDKVLVGGDIVLGEIAEVHGDTSKVKLYSSPGEKFEVRVGKENIQTTATGRGGGNFELVLPREIKLSPGDPVTIPAISLNLFGTVEAVVGDPARPFQTILFKNPVNIYEQKWVQVEKSI